MPKTRARYTPEFRRQMVDLVRAGRDPDDLAREFEPTAQSIRNWVAVAGAKMGGRGSRADRWPRLRRRSTWPMVETGLPSLRAIAGLDRR